MPNRGQGQGRSRGRGQGRGRGRGRGNVSRPDSPPMVEGLRLGILRIEDSPPPDSHQYLELRLPPLRPATGPPLNIQGMVGGLMMREISDVRLEAVSRGFPISVHPIHIPNTRAQLSTASTHSVIDFRFVRLAGLLHNMVLLRPEVDNVVLKGPMGSPLDVLGWVDVTFDALGYQFRQKCWVINLSFPVEIQLGMDWVSANEISFSMGEGVGNIVIKEADAKKARNVQEIYAMT